MANGSIYYDKSKKKWKCAYYVRDQNTLDEIRKSKSFTTEEDAKDFLTSIQYQKGNDLFVKNNGIPLNQLMRANAQKRLDMNLIGERQYARILHSIKKLELSPILYKNIDEINSNDIQEYLNTLTEYSDSTIKKLTEQFTQAFKYALNKGYITKNPMVDIVKPKSSKPTKIVRALELEEQQIFTNYLMNTSVAEEPFKVAYLMEMYMGMRIGEVLALRSTDIDLRKNLVHINKTLTTDKDYKVIMGKSPKTYAGIREVPIPEFIKNEIINQMMLAENNFDKQLFVNVNGGYMDPRNANRLLKKSLKRLGIEDVSTHSLRHTYGTRCIEAGMRAVALQRLMGHTDISVTLNTYTSVFNKYKEAELEKLNNYYISNSIIEQNQELLNRANNIILNNNEKGENERRIKESQDER